MKAFDARSIAGQAIDRMNLAPIRALIRQTARSGGFSAEFVFLSVTSIKALRDDGYEVEQNPAGTFDVRW